MYTNKFVPLIREHNNNNNNNNNNRNLIQFYSFLVYVSAKSIAGWPVIERAQHTNTNDKG
jgi:hypothetical protein